jgi:hypothetical protein
MASSLYRGCDSSLEIFGDNEIMQNTLSNCFFKSELLYGAIDLEVQSDLDRGFWEKFKEVVLIALCSC